LVVDRYSTAQPPPAAAPPPPSPAVDGDVIVSMQGRHAPLVLRALWWLLCLCTGGVVALLGRWYPGMWLRVATRPAPLSHATLVVVRRASGAVGQSRVESEDTPSRAQAGRSSPGSHVHGRRTGTGSEKQPLLSSPSSRSSSGYCSDAETAAERGGSAALAAGGAVRFFTHRHLRYVYDAALGTFVHTTGLVGTTTVAQLLRHRALPSPGDAQRIRLRAVHGNNSIDVEVKGYVQLCVEEVLSPFYIL